MNPETLQKLTESFNLLSKALEKANAKGAYTLSEASVVHQALMNVKTHVEQSLPKPTETKETE
tara:strand:- start:70 stop:258 length:189 start_codon:yes stop_codon:yes gene_type:complete